MTSLEEHPEIVAGDGSLLREILKPARDGLAVRYSLAYARVPPGESTFPHRLRESAEVYFFLCGQGRMYIGDEEANVHAGQAVYIPPGTVQYIENTGCEDLIFLCIVDPAWRPEDEEVLTSWGHRNGR